MKITHIIPDLSTGGAQRLLQRLLSAMAENPDVEVTLVVYKSVKDSPVEKSLRDNGLIRFVNLDLKRTRDASAALRMVSEVRNADIAHLHLFPALYQGALASAIAGTPVVFTEHSTDNRRRHKRWLKPMERYVYSRYERVCAVSGAAAENLAEWLGYTVARNLGERGVLTVPNGIDVARFNEDRPHPSLLPSIFGRGGRPVVMTGRFAKSKDQDTLIRALAKMKTPDAFVAFAGEGERLDECRRLALKLGVEDRVMFLGDRDDIPRILAAAEVGVLSSKWEGFGLAALEMMAAGLPVVASDVEGLRDIVAGAGILFNPGDDDMLARTLDSLLEETANEYERESAKNGGNEVDNEGRVQRIAAMREKGRRRAAEYDIRFTANAYLDVYRSILSRSDRSERVLREFAE